MPKAYVVQENGLDFNPVKEFADYPPEVVFGVGQVRLDPQAALVHARDVLSYMNEDDYLVMAGDPVMMGICVVVVAELFGVVRFLRWDRRNSSYVVVEVNFD